jgi:putative endonuclease
LEALGYTILDRSYHTRYGEIDLVTRDPHGMVVFVEVKTRRTKAYGLPEASVTVKKREHLLAAVQSYLQAHPATNGGCRYDVIAIRVLDEDAPPEIVHFENAIA